MAAVNITINGVICDLYGRTITGPVKIVGEAMYSDLGVGGGPVFPPSGGGGGGGGGGGDGKPPSIWPSPGRPEHPIVLPPDGLPPGTKPPEIWPSPGHPEHPIVLPPPPTEGTGPDGGKPPPPEGGWGYHPVYGWGYFPGGGGKPQPPG